MFFHINPQTGTLEIFFLSPYNPGIVIIFCYGIGILYGPREITFVLPENGMGKNKPESYRLAAGKFQRILLFYLLRLPFIEFNKESALIFFSSGIFYNQSIYPGLCLYNVKYPLCRLFSFLNFLLLNAGFIRIPLFQGLAPRNKLPCNAFPRASLKKK